jgi:hypothetical protein
MVHRGGESEPIVIDTESPGLVVIELDDGEELVIHAGELRAALTGGGVRDFRRPHSRMRAGRA